MRQGTLIGPIIVAIGLIAAGIVFAVVGTLLETADGTMEIRIDSTDQEVARLRAEIAKLQEEQREMRTELRKLAEEVALKGNAPAVAAPTLTAPEIDGLDETGDDAVTEDMTDEMITAKNRFNRGVTQPRNRTMLEIMGHPRSSYSTNCEPVTNPRLKALMETRRVGPIRVTMLKPALESLERIVKKLEASEPDIHAALGTAGALCARLIRGSKSSVSNHSWGTAIDLKLEGKLDGFGDGGTQFGLLLLAELFNEEGWYWGAGFRREDSMHFEVGEETLRKWLAEGKL